MTIELVKTLSHTLSDSDLVDAISMLCAARKDRQNKRLLEMKNTLVAGDIVEFYHSKKKEYIRGKIRKVKTKKAIVVEEARRSFSMTWDVPMGMLRKVMQ